MPRQNRLVEGLIPESCKIRKRGCSSSSSSSSVLQNYQFKRAILVGKPPGSRSSTPVPSWRTTAAALDSRKTFLLDLMPGPNFFFVALIVEAQEAVAAIEAGGNVAGGRGFYLKGDGVRLNQALINFGLDFVEKRGYTALQTPFFMRKDIMAKCAQLAQFDEELYKNGLDTKVEKSRKQLKERKNRTKKIRGVKKVRKLLILALGYTYTGQSLSLSLSLSLLHNVQTKAGDAAKAGKKK
ncbi:hypothetical protein TEA_023771 [Camellia sinensis var. sinensis]|uniref:Uncharacterized protein n=1 Tax=Camellia sinensis var. sinensis TaxID=542762 RepID=A0A4V3WQ04_CAMSN|nr:hypothetical protein TEA_023771 [Camellia sinensis var. sinensis]